MIVFRQLYDAASSTYTYLVGDGGEAVLIDPVFEQARRDAALIAELGLRLVATLETHVHADHVTAAWQLKQKLGSEIVISAASGAHGADRLLAHGDRVRFGDRALEMRATPGHTAGCASFVLDDQTFAFTGDCLLVRGCGRTDFQQGDARALYRSVHEQLFTLPDACQLWPGHDYHGRTVTTVGEEKQHNPRLGGARSIDDFVGYMRNLSLPHPKQLAIAVPANLECGRPSEAKPLPPEPTWAKLTLTFAGMWELEPRWLEEHASDVQLIDVRDRAEYDGELGRIRGARLVPIDRLRDELGSLDRSRPIVCVCRSGARSAQATVLLAAAGFDRVANLAGGMLRWNAEGLPVEHAVP